MKSITVAISLLVASVVAVNDKAAAAGLDAIAESDGPDIIEKSNLRRLQSGSKDSQQMAKWKKAHNDMRKKYHVDFGGEFTAINWNMKLKNEAEAWAKQLVKNCVNRLPDDDYNENGYGVNSAMKMGLRDFQDPNAVMNMWENKLKLGYPKNQEMTQVLWSATRYVGCADASSGAGAKKTCSASVCYYAKPGNCAFSRFGGNKNWTQAVLYGPGCSTACPTNLETC
jgi:hypothetical protein